MSRWMTQLIRAQGAHVESKTNNERKKGGPLSVLVLCYNTLARLSSVTRS
ncbi:hypothetical protein T08_7777, partial [Trichinella sp. T8]